MSDFTQQVEIGSEWVEIVVVIHFYPLSEKILTLRSMRSEIFPPPTPTMEKFTFLMPVCASTSIAY